MKFKEYIRVDELFDKPYEYEKMGNLNYSFEDENGDEFDIFFEMVWPDETDYIVFEVLVGNVNPDEEGYHFYFQKNGSTRMSRSSNEFRVLATIQDILVDFRSNNTMNFFYYSADNKSKSRQRFYDKMTPKLMRQFRFSDYQIVKGPTGEKYYILY